MSNRTPQLAAAELTKRFGPVVAVNKVTTTLSAGITGLLGPNGAGKTTLIRMLAGVESPTVGTFTVNGQPAIGRRLRSFQAELGYLPQQPSWHRWMNVEDIVGEFAWMRAVPRGEIASNAREALARVGLSPEAKKPARALSGGQFQRLMLATALVHKPRYLLLDEPTVGLDPEQRVQFREILAEFAAQSVVLVSTHLLEDVSAVADRVLVLSAGSVCFDGTLADLTKTSTQEGVIQTASALELAYLRLMRPVDE